MLENTIHYLWIGVPTNDDALAIAGHDVAGPIAVARRLKQQASEGGAINPIKFWCQRDYLDSYKMQFHQLSVDDCIEVCAVEDLLEKSQQDERLSEDARLLNLELMAISKSGHARDRIHFKDHISFLILASQGGYFFDTNVFPMRNVKISLSGDDKSWTARGPDSKTQHDFFLMYTPYAYSEASLCSLYSYRPDSKSTLFLGFSGPRSYNEVEAMGVKKLSYKSYCKREDKIQGLFYWLDYPSELEEMLDYGNINSQVVYSANVAVLEKIDFYRVPYRQHLASKEELLTLPFSNLKSYTPRE